MSDKTLSGYLAGEYLQFQKDVVPETTLSYDLGTRTQPFYALHAAQLPLTHIQTFSALPHAASPNFPLFCAYFDSATRLVITRSATQRSGVNFTTF